MSAPRGRKPKPTPLKLVAGNPGKRALPKDEPKLEIVVPPPPDYLDDVARNKWDIVCRQLADAKIMTVLDIDAIALYCATYSRYLFASKKLAEHGFVNETPQGFTVQSAYLQIVNKTQEQMLKIETEFGMTASSRTRVAVRPQKEKPDGWDEL